MNKAMVYLAVAFGSALGGVGRFWLSELAIRRLGESWPWGTLVVNVTGSFAIGFFAAITGPGGRWLEGSRYSLFFMTGVCGGYTTFSTFSLQTLRLAQTGQVPQAAANALASVVLCLAAVWLGYVAGQAWNR